MVAFLLALVLIFLILQRSFESLCDPVIIIPHRAAGHWGALISLKLFDQTLNIFSQIRAHHAHRAGAKTVSWSWNLPTRNRLAAIRRSRPWRMRPWPFPPHPDDQFGHGAGRFTAGTFAGRYIRQPHPIGRLVMWGVMFSPDYFTLLWFLPFYSFLSSRKKKSALDDESEWLNKNIPVDEAGVIYSQFYFAAALCSAQNISTVDEAICHGTENNYDIQLLRNDSASFALDNSVSQKWLFIQGWMQQADWFITTITSCRNFPTAPNLERNGIRFQ